MAATYLAALAAAKEKFLAKVGECSTSVQAYDLAEHIAQLETMAATWENEDYINLLVTSPWMLSRVPTCNVDPRANVKEVIFTVLNDALYDELVDLIPQELARS